MTTSWTVEPNVVGEQFDLTPDCGAPPGCPLIKQPPQILNNNQVEYVPAEVMHPHDTGDICPPASASCALSTYEDYQDAIQCSVNTYPGITGVWVSVSELRRR